MEFYKIKLQMIRDKTLLYDKPITQPNDIVKFINTLENYDLSTIENTVVIALSTKNEIVAYAEIGKGTLNGCGLDIPSIFRVVLMANSSKFILVHNHPSGDSTPSKTDIKATKNILDASKLMQIQFLDHIIIGDNTFTSIFNEIINEGGE